MATPKHRTKEERRKVRERIKALRQEGLSLSQIGEKVGLTSATVGYYLAYSPYYKQLATGVSKKVKPKKIVSVLGSPVHANGDNSVGYAAGFVDAWLQHYATGKGLDAAILKKEVLEVLEADRG